MNVLLTGGAGFIGRRVRALLESAGSRVQTLDLEDGIDLSNWKQVEALALEPFEVVIHMAARSFVPASFEDPRSFFETNLMGTANALELARRQGARVVFMSSYVYGVPDYLPIDEGHLLRAINPYGESKILGEHLCRSYARYQGVPSVLIRPFNVYGAGQDANFLIPQILTQAASGKVELKDPRPRRDFIYVDDVAAGVVAAAGLPLEKGQSEAVNLGSGKSLSLQDVLATIEAVYPQPFETVFSGEQRPNEVLDTVSNIEKAERLLQWTPKVSFAAGIQKMISHYAPK